MKIWKIILISLGILFSVICISVIVRINTIIEQKKEVYEWYNRSYDSINNFYELQYLENEYKYITKSVTYYGKELLDIQTESDLNCGISKLQLKRDLAIIDIQYGIYSEIGGK